MEGMGLEEEWMASILKERTRENYERGWRHFKEYTGKTAEELLELRRSEGRKRFETRIVMFYKSIQETRKICENTARTYCIPIEAFFSYYDLPLKLSSILPSITMKLEKYKPTLEDIQKVYKYNDLNVKAWLNLSRDIPARVNDLLRISKEQLTEEFLFKSGKRNVIGKCYVTPETIEIWKRVTAMPITQKGIHKMLKKACEVAGIHHINPHLLRKWWHTTATNLNINADVIKILEFKSVSKDILTYNLDREELRVSWQRVITALPLEPKNGNGRVSSLEEVVKILAEAQVRVMLQNLTMEEREKLGLMKMLDENPIEAMKTIVAYLKQKEENPTLRSKEGAYS
jgi:hypothetical protein